MELKKKKAEEKELKLQEIAAKATENQLEIEGADNMDDG
jgi:hypothetical protein